MQASVKHSEFFFTEHLKREIQPYTLDRIISRGSEGLYQIENTPEVAPLDGEDVLEDSVF